MGKNDPNINQNKFQTTLLYFNNVNPYLVGGFNPSEKYARPKWKSSPIFGMIMKTLWNHHLLVPRTQMTQYMFQAFSTVKYIPRCSISLVYLTTFAPKTLQFLWVNRPATSAASGMMLKNHRTITSFMVPPPEKTILFSYRNTTPWSEPESTDHLVVC